MRKWIDVISEHEDWDWEGYADDVDPDYEQDMKPARLPATPENIAKAKEFVMKKWIERHNERYGNIAAFRDKAPTDLSNACKFSSMFAREIFGGRLRGNQAHQFVELPDGQVLDLNIDAADVKQMADPHHHDEQYFWGNPEHKEALDSCRPRVQQWVDEFLRDNLTESVRLPKPNYALVYDDDQMGTVYKNPTAGLLKQLIGPYDQRALLFTNSGNVYSWPQTNMFHGDVRDYLLDNGIEHGPAAFLKLCNPDATHGHPLVSIKGEADEDEAELITQGPELDALHRNRALVQLYGPNFAVDSYDWR